MIEYYGFITPESLRLWKKHKITVLSFRQRDPDSYRENDEKSYLLNKRF